MRRIAPSRLPIGWLIAVSVTLGAVPLALLTYFSVTLADDAVRHEARARVASTAAISAFAVRNELEALAELVRSYAQRPFLVSAIANGNRARIRSELRQLQHARPGIYTAFLARSDGALVDIVPPTPSIVGKDFSFRDWYKGVTRTRRP
jgi:hypothetical protein